MNRDFNEPLYKKVLLLMLMDRGYEADFFERYVPQPVFDQLLKEANVGQPDMEYIRSVVEQAMDDLIEELTGIRP